MVSLSRTDPDSKHKSILSRERSWAHSVVMAVINAKPITVWEVMIPVLFIFNYARSKSDRELFSKNLLFTKELALNAALDMVKNNRSREVVMSQIDEKTRGLLSSVKNGIYVEEIRKKQIGEIDLLIDHYCKLLRVDGNDYSSLVINAYKSLEKYTDFLLQLKKVEKEVNLAAMQTLGAKTDSGIVSKIEEAVNRIRMATAQNIF